MFRSLRWRLSMSYAGIALITALAIGAILITTLRGYYARREQDYLMTNAATIGRSVADLLASDQDAAVVSDQIGVLSFLTQTRIRVMDANQYLIADTGSPESSIRYVVFSQTSDEPMPGLEPGVKTQVFSIAGGPTLVTRGEAYEGADYFTLAIPAIAPLNATYGESGGSVAWEDVLIPRQVSDQKATLTIFGAQGQHLGMVELSEGPAYGSQIVSSVIWAWLAASLFGMAVAATSGWWVSRQISRPLVLLTEVTSRMARGDMATRADIATGDEFETLAHSFNEMAGRVEQTITALKRFVADAAHELDTPLTALRTNLELILTAAHETQHPEHVRESLLQVRRLETLTHNLLDLSRIEARRDKGERVDIAALIHRAGESAASRAEQAGVTFEMETLDDPVFISGSDALLERAVMNLLDNAIKFTPSGGRVQLRLEEGEDAVNISVEDTGIGIPEDELPLLFSRFHRARNASSYPGNGLGLALVKAIVENHDGEISVSRSEEGTRFVISLPRNS